MHHGQTKKVFDRNLTDWSARYKKNRSNLECLEVTCEQLRHEVAKQQEQVDLCAETLEDLEEKQGTKVLLRLQNAKQAHEEQMQSRNLMQAQLVEHRKMRQSLMSKKAALCSDYERRHAELNRVIEVRDKLEDQLHQLEKQLGKLSRERKTMERELGMVQSSIRDNTDVADELSHEMESVVGAIKDSVELHMASPSPSKLALSMSSSSPRQSPRQLGPRQSPKPRSIEKDLDQANGGSASTSSLGAALLSSANEQKRAAAAVGMQQPQVKDMESDLDQIQRRLDRTKRLEEQGESSQTRPLALRAESITPR